MQKKIVWVVVGVVVLVGVGMYLLRPVAAPSAPAVEATAPVTVAPMSGVRVFAVAAGSMATYEIDEELRGKPVHVVGTTDQLAGEIAVTVGTSPAITVGDLAINARTFKTDSANRDNAVARFILKSEEEANEFITFKQIAVRNLPAMITFGAPFEFEAVGELTIAGVTKPAVFMVKNVIITDVGLTGVATATVKRSDFGLQIPSIPSVANVTDEVLLTAKVAAAAK